MLKQFILIISLFITLTVKGQDEYIEGEFRSPLGIPLVLSGTFAELRSNHFHGGIDIKTNGKEGYKVYATKEGFVSRIKVQPGGYGHALYIDHPNGYTTVYGHLKRFNDEITNYVRTQQYAQQSFEVDLYLSPGQFTVAQGEVIAVSGNTGSSGGPHLHYEIRKTNGQIPINPLKYTSVKDDIKPTIYNIRIHELVSSLYNANSKTVDVSYVSSGEYRVNDTVRVNYPVVGFSVKSFDKLNGANNSNGFVSLKMYVDGQLNFEYKKNQIPFDKSRYLNAHIDYPAKKLGNGTYVNCFKLPGNDLDIYEPHANDGRIWLQDYPIRNVSVTICDFAGNESNLNFIIKYEKKSTDQLKKEGTLMDHSIYNVFTEPGIRIDIPNGALYDDFYLTYEKNETSIPNYPIYSSLHQVANETIPLHKFITVEVEAKDIPSDLRNKALLANLDRNGNIDVNTGTWIGDYFQIKTRNFGQYFITTDTQKPTIKNHQAPSDLNYTASTHMMFKISDDLSGIKSYRATVDGNWILMNYDPKRNLLFHEFDDKINKGKHKLVLEVGDYVNNTSTVEFDFIR